MPSPDFLGLAADAFRGLKSLADRAIAQVADADLHRVPGPGSNSVAVTMKHVAGNLRSRWTDFLTTDGEKPWRRRDREFEEGTEGRADLLARWEDGWRILFETLASLRESDLARPVRIRTEVQPAMQAILRQISHYGYHVGQIVYAARWLAGPSWKTLSIPRGESEAYNRSLGLETPPVTPE